MADVERNGAEMRDASLATKQGAELADQNIVEGKKSSKGVVLRPQPTNDPNEPLVSCSIDTARMDMNAVLK